MALIKCSECGKKISANAKACAGCGNPVKHEKNKVSGRVVFVLLIFIVIASISLMPDNNGKSPAQLRQQVCDNPVNAYRFTQNFVKLTLKSPSSAVFPDYSASIVRRSGDCRYLIDSYVDSQNGFSAMLRTAYRMDIQYDMDNDKWTVLDQDIIN